MFKGKINKRCTSFLVAFAMFFTMCQSGFTTNAKAADNEVNLQILATSDTHGRFMPYDYSLNTTDKSGSLAQVATAVKELRKVNPNTLLVDAGDIIQDNSSALFLNDSIHPMIAAMNGIQYDTITAGNHEFNYGVPTLKNIVSKSTADFLCANLYDSNGNRVFKPYTIIEKAGVKIAIIGTVSQNIERWDKVNIPDAGYKVTTPVDETKKAIAEIKNNNLADIIIAVSHVAEGSEYGTVGSSAYEIADACPELTAIVAAHEHKKVSGVTRNGVLIVENQNGAKTLAQINLKLTKGTDGTYSVVDKSSKLNTISNYAPDEDLVKILQPYNERAISDANEVIGKLVGGNLVPSDEAKGIPTSQIQETAMINLINKVQMHYSGAKVSAAAAFNSRANMLEGNIKKCDTSLIYKYDNTLYKLKMTGAQLKKYMEWSASYYNTYKDGDLTVSFNENIRGYNYDMFSGVKYDVDISKEAGNRITNLTWMDGTPIKDNETFEIAINNYRANSQLLSYGPIYQKGEDLPILVEKDIKGDIGGVRELIRDYIINVKGGTISPELDNNWKIIGNNWNPELRALAVQLLNDGTISVPMSADGRTPNVKSITVDDIKAYIPEKPSDNNNSIDKPSYEDKLPQTGSVVDTNVLLLFGFLTILIGSMLAKSKKEQDL
ncbi:5'-nucleotidase C-terminal domain-containing protein [Clostridium cadaveris]|uniref:2',3'-cyclic-nucleotide 2'-phosphodiesterase / 3'-nucleotidase n=1 Tax=Clostridium cadaveris TaxID=1529 RepID=A0A1I2PCX5_9CLOT|nr:5'-nucleotidase C-terminal domain-containing protein [Clostridium cadaveris]MDM8312953.1 5'-nucleotidase C-terminal domain-containing protein [Clostridium cadaveris]NME65774.1 LPXTG cell wall anchor domain-containing protein [Clostridium cadaveris]SFG11301.1 2',3'-cyclic-nucleotide 2'-phosphodiesterase / 3'-nucleotidase [Clostridium cadaveris]